MKLILPIAGVGTRLRPFTFSKPKAFIKAAGARVVDHIFKKIEESTYTGENVPLLAVTGYRERQIQEYFNENYGKKYDLGYITQVPRDYDGDIPLFGGLGEAILITKEWFEKKKEEREELKKKSGKIITPRNITFILLGDMIPVNNYEHIFRNLEQDDVDAVIGTMVVPKEKTQFYGIVERDEKNTIKMMIEKPNSTHSNEAIAGVYAFKDSTMKRLYEILENQFNIHKKEPKTKEFQFTPALQQLVEEGFNIKSSSFDEGILDFGHHNAVLWGNKVLLEQRSNGNAKYLKKNNNIIQSSFVEESCAIGTNSTIKRSVIGPYVSIGDNCTIENCTLKNTVVGDNIKMTKIITKNTIIGDNVIIDGIIKDNMIIGDDSYIIEDRQK